MDVQTILQQGKNLKSVITESLVVGIGESIAIADETIVNSDITLDELTERAYKVIDRKNGLTL